MLLFLLSYIGGVLTILSPCILPVIPFVFAKADQPFRKSGLPLLLGMAITFAGFSSLAVLGGAWVAQANNWGRWIAIVLMTIFGLSLAFPQFFEKAFEPFTRLGSKISSSSGAGTKKSSFSHSMLLGAATGLLWAPCAGPILGLILTGAATQGTPEKAVWLLFAYALGAATSLMLALIAGGKFLGALKKSLKAERAVKTTLGIAVLLGVAVISFNLDRTVLTRISRLQTEDLEGHLIDLIQPSHRTVSGAPKEDPMQALSPNLAGATKWLNSPALTLDSLKGKVVVVDFWTYSCINCLRTLPYVKAWAEKYKDQGLVVIGVHTPEFAFEKDPENVAKALTDLGITYPVAMDNNYSIWNTFENRYWPAHYFFDRGGKIRHHHFGEGGYAKSEQVIQELLQEGTGKKIAPSDLVTSQVQGEGALAASKFSNVKSPETYIGYARAKNLRVEPAMKADSPVKYQSITSLKLNDWSMSGAWNIGKEKAVAVKSGGRIIYRFHARDLHLVLGPQTPGTAISFRVTLDGKAPGKDRGVDINEKGEGLVNENRLYQLIRQTPENEKMEDRTFEIEFLSPGVEVFAFTFG